MSKYAPLTDHLNQHQGERWRARFSEIERVLGFQLPKSARHYPAWWANDARQGRQCMAWISVGWITQELDLGSEAVTFRRTGRVHQAMPASPQRKIARSERSIAPSADALSLKTTPVSSLDVRIKMEWRNLGRLQLDPNGSLLFPDRARAPGLYRFRLTGRGMEQRYIGETVDLQRRFLHYRTPGPSQMTNIRIKELFLDRLNGGGRVEIDIVVDDVEIVVGGESRAADLSDKATRRLLENAAIVVEGAHEVGSLNR